MAPSPGMPAKRKAPIWVVALLCFLVISCQDASQQANQHPEARDGEDSLVTTTQERNRFIVFFGNSITAGYQLSPEEAFPSLIQERLDSLGYGQYGVINAGVSGETSADGLSRIEWTLRQPLDIFVLELGGNDGLRGMALAETKKNLQAILSAVQQRYPEARLMVAGMEIPPNMGPEYTQAFRAMYPSLAKQFDATLIPFLLEDVAGIPHLNLDDGIHPTAEGHLLLTNTVWEYLLPLISP